MGAALVRFVLGAAVGSFVGVLADRYDPARPLFRRKSLGGRSRCASCGASLRWYELIPVVSFLIQRGRCRACNAAIPASVFAIELLCGAVFVAVPAALPSSGGLAALWTAVFVILALLSWIDARFTIIPDEANVLLIALGVLRLAAFGDLPFPGEALSFAGPPALLFGVFPSPWIARAAGLFAGALLFGVILALTRGRGMGMGDVKLAAALGFLFGWPDILFIAAFSFILGSIVGIVVVVSGRKTLKSAVPFGPFLALGSATLFFSGAAIVRWYFGLFAGV